MASGHTCGGRHKTASPGHKTLIHGRAQGPRGDKARDPPGSHLGLGYRGQDGGCLPSPCCDGEAGQCSQRAWRDGQAKCYSSVLVMVNGGASASEKPYALW